MTPLRRGGRKPPQIMPDATLPSRPGGGSLSVLLLLIRAWAVAGPFQIGLNSGKHTQTYLDFRPGLRVLLFSQNLRSG